MLQHPNLKDRLRLLAQPQLPHNAVETTTIANTNTTGTSSSVQAAQLTAARAFKLPRLRDDIRYGSDAARPIGQIFPTKGIPTSQIETWNRTVTRLERTYDFTADKRLPSHSVDATMNTRNALFEGEITTLEIDAIVAPNNSELTRTDHVCGEIFQALGPPFEA